jgi:hypothetical protein
MIIPRMIITVQDQALTQHVSSKQLDCYTLFPLR